MTRYDIAHIHTLLARLTRLQRKQLIKSVRAKGIPLLDIQPYTYPEAKGIPHVFLYFEGGKTPIPYFMIDEKLWGGICEEIIKLSATSA